MGFATIKKDRFVALSASFDGGEVVTRPVILAGKSLHLNAKAGFGEIVVQAMDASGNRIAESKAVQQNGLDLTVQWKDGRFPAQDQPVTLRITLKNACLFAIWSN